MTVRAAMVAFAVLTSMARGSVAAIDPAPLIEVSVRNARTSRPMPDAAVNVFAAAPGATSGVDAQGQVRIPLAPGPNRLVAVAPGFVGFRALVPPGAARLPLTLPMVDATRVTVPPAPFGRRLARFHRAPWGSVLLDAEQDVPAGATTYVDVPTREEAVLSATSVDGSLLGMWVERGSGFASALKATPHVVSIQLPADVTGADCLVFAYPADLAGTLNPDLLVPLVTLDVPPLSARVPAGRWLIVVQCRDRIFGPVRVDDGSAIVDLVAAPPWQFVPDLRVRGKSVTHVFVEGVPWPRGDSRDEWFSTWSRKLGLAPEGRPLGIVDIPPAAREWSVSAPGDVEGVLVSEEDSPLGLPSAVLARLDDTERFVGRVEGKHVRFSQVPFGEYRLWILGDRIEPTCLPVTVGPGESPTRLGQLMVRSAGRVTGRVVEGSSQQPVGGARVELITGLGRQDRVVLTTARADGTFTIDGLRRVDAVLAASLEGHVAANESEGGTCAVPLASRAVAECELRLSRLGRIAATVLAPDSSPHAGVAGSCYRIAAGTRSSRAAGHATADSDGVLLFESLRDGDYVVTLDDRAEESEIIRVATTETSLVVIHERECCIAGRLTRGGAPIAARVSSRSLRTATEPGDAATEYEICGIAPGRATLFVMARSESGWWATESPVVIPTCGRIVHDIDLPLLDPEQPIRVSGAVRDRESRALVPQTTVRVWGPSTDRTVVALDGRFTTELPGEGTYSFESIGGPEEPCRGVAIVEREVTAPLDDLDVEVACMAIETFTFTDEAGAPLQGVRVEALGGRSAQAGVFVSSGLTRATDAMGRVEVPLPEGYDRWLFVSSALAGWGLVRASGAVLRLSGSGTVELPTTRLVKLRPSGSAALPWIQVEAGIPHVAGGIAEASGDGLVLRGLLEGNYMLEANGRTTEITVARGLTVSAEIR